MHQVAGRKGGEKQAGRWLGATGQLSHSGKEQRGRETRETGQIRSNELANGFEVGAKAVWGRGEAIDET